jgi:hypothetical protein
MTSAKPHSIILVFVPTRLENMGEPILVVKDLSRKVDNGTTIFSDISFKVNQGGILHIKSVIAFLYSCSICRRYPNCKGQKWIWQVDFVEVYCAFGASFW